jgi:hypothetical protein
MGELASTAFVLAHLAKKPFQMLPSDAADAYLNEATAHLATWNGPVDLVGGLVGLGILGAEANHLRFRRAVARALASRAKPPFPAFLRPKLFKKGDFTPVLDFGVAHGVGGLVGVLSRLVTLDVLGVTSALRRSTKWLLELLTPAPLGYYVGDRRKARAGWCYGEAALSLVLLHATRVLGDQMGEAVAIDIGLRAAARRNPEAQVNDAGLCHGSAGLGLSFARLFAATGNDAFHEAAEYWFTLTPSFGTSEGAFGAYPRRSISSFLEGTAGVALALMAAVSPVEPAWDRLLLYSQ